MNRTFTALFVSFTMIAAASADRVSPLLNDMPRLHWQEKAPGVWSAVIGEEEAFTYMDFAGASPKVEALEKMPAVVFPFVKEDTRGAIAANRAVARIPLAPEEKLYGLGLQFQGMNRRGKVYHLRMDHYSSGNERLHAPVPFYVSSAGYGVLFNSPRYIAIYAGVGNRHDSPEFPAPRDRNTDGHWDAQPASDAVEASVVSGGMEVLVFAGPTPLDAIRRYNLYCGGGCLPPKWGLGFWHRMRTHADAAEVLKEVDDFNKRGFPLDVIGLEPGWHSKAYPCTYEWNPMLFPQPADFLNAMTAEGIGVNLWENPYVSPDAGIYDAIKPYCGSHTVWLGIVPDFTLPEAREIYKTQHAGTHVALGVSGYKVDEVDGYDFWLWPDHAVFPSGTSAEVMRQTYGLQMQKMQMEIFRAQNRRTYGQVRASNAGASNYPFAIYTDHYDHRGFVSALINCGFSGVLYTPEIRSAGSPEEWVRRMQTVCFSPLVQLNGWADNTKPWTFEEVENEVREVIKLRQRLLPYMYTAFGRYHFEGTPPIRAMVLEPGYEAAEIVEAGRLDGTDNPYAMAVRKDVADQYMFGDCLLVAPLFTRQKSRDVILPRGRWYDFYTGNYAGGGEVVNVTAPLNQIPLFVKDGGIIPMIPDVDRIAGMGNDTPLEIRHYGETPSTAMLYDDDGVSFDFEAGRYCWQEMTVTRNSQGGLDGRLSEPIGNFVPAYGEATWKFMTK